jgi:hypothetical protein
MVLELPFLLHRIVQLSQLLNCVVVDNVRMAEYSLFTMFSTCICGNIYAVIVEQSTT